MSQKSALAWYHRNKGSDAIKKRRNKRQEAFKTLGGRLLLSCDYAAKKRTAERFGQMGGMHPCIARQLLERVRLLRASVQAISCPHQPRRERRSRTLAPRPVNRL